MELNEIKLTWNEMNDDFQRLNGAVTTTQKEQSNKRVKIALNREPIFGVILASISLILSGSFIADHFATWTQIPWLSLPALLVHGFLILILGQSILQLIAVSKLDLSQPITEAQNNLLKINALNLKATKAAILIGTTIWFAFPMVLIQALTTPEIISKVSPGWIAANVAFGFACIAAAFTTAKRMAPNHKITIALDHLLSGNAIKEAQNEIDNIKQFSS